MSQISLPKINFETHNRLAQFIDKIGVTPDVGKPLFASVWVSRNLNTSQISELKIALSKYGLLCFIDGPFSLFNLNDDQPYFVLKFKTTRNRDIVINDIQRIKNIGKILANKSSKTQNTTSNSNRASIADSNLALIPVQSTTNFDKIFESIKPYKNYIIVALAVIVLFILIKKK